MKKKECNRTTHKKIEKNCAILGLNFLLDQLLACVLYWPSCPALVCFSTSSWIAWRPPLSKTGNTSPSWLLSSLKQPVWSRSKRAGDWLPAAYLSCPASPTFVRCSSKPTPNNVWSLTVRTQESHKNLATVAIAHSIAWETCYLGVAPYISIQQTNSNTIMIIPSSVNTIQRNNNLLSFTLTQLDSSSNIKSNTTQTP